MIKHLNIDGDSLIYKAACPCEVKQYVLTIGVTVVMTFQYKKELIEYAKDMPEEWGDFEWKYEVVGLEPLSYALHTLKRKIGLILKETQCSSYNIFLTQGDNFRHTLAKTRPYKGKRLGKPVHFQDCFDYLVKYYDAYVCLGIEADDILAMKQTHDTCIAHIDKDLDTVEGLHFNYDTLKTYRLSAHAAKLNFYRQFLTGDTSDNIKGVTGIGEVKAAKLLTMDMTEQEMFGVIMVEFDYDYTRILETGQLLHMTRELHDDGRPVLWEIPNF